MMSVNNAEARRKGLSLVLRALFLVLISYVFLLQSFAQERHFSEQDLDFRNREDSWIESTKSTDCGHTRQDSLVMQSAEQNKDIVINDVTASLLSSGLPGDYNETYFGLKNFWSEDIVSNFFANIGQVVGRWLTEFLDGWISQIVQFLAAALRTFVLNPNVAISGFDEHSGGNRSDDISPLIRQAADIVYGIAIDLLLLLFILAIWRYWSDAAWRGDVGIMGAVGRLIFTAGLMLVWPTVYAFEIQITNEMIKALYANSANQLATLDTAMALAVKGGLVAGIALLTSAFAPIVGQVAGAAIGGVGGMVLGTVGGVVSFVGLIIYLVLGGILIGQLIYLLVLKAIQTALLTAQYMFAPVFLVCFATPDTENVTSGFVKSFVEVSLWTFFWVGLLKILVIILSSDFNPWGKIILSIGILQMMIRVPSFLARARISPMSNYISSGSVSQGLVNGARTFADFALTRTQQWFQSQSQWASFDASNAQSPGLKVNKLSDGLSNEPAFRRSNDTWGYPSDKEAPFNEERSKRDRTAVLETVLGRTNEREQEANSYRSITKARTPTTVARQQVHSGVTAYPNKEVNEIARVAQATLLKNIEQGPKSKQQKKPEKLREDGTHVPKPRNEESLQAHVVKIPGPPARSTSSAGFHAATVPTALVDCNQRNAAVDRFICGDSQIDRMSAGRLQRDDQISVEVPRLADGTGSREHPDFTSNSQDVTHRNVPLGNIPLQDLVIDGTTPHGVGINMLESNVSTVDGGDIASSYVPAVKGVSTYIAALIKNDCPAGTPNIIQDKIASWIGCNIPQDKVNACLAIARNSPIEEKECENIELVKTVANVGASNGNTPDAYNNAYLNYKCADSELSQRVIETTNTNDNPSYPAGAGQFSPCQTLSQSITQNNPPEKHLQTWDNGI